MSEPFISEIRVFPFKFAPRGWAFCNGDLLPVKQNPALYSLIGNIYGGDGHSTFALPDMRGRAPLQPGHGHGLSDYKLGETGGSETVALSEGESPAHRHVLGASPDIAEKNKPAGGSFARTTGINLYQSDTTANLVPMAEGSVSPTGGGAPHNNMMPYLTLNFCIALEGEYPSEP